MYEPWTDVGTEFGSTTVWENGIVADRVRVDIGESMVPGLKPFVAFTFWNSPNGRTSVTWIRKDSRRRLGWGARTKDLTN